MASTEPKQWTTSVNNDLFLVSTDHTLIPLNFLQGAFASDDMYWAKPFSDETMKLMLNNSCMLGLFQLQHQPSASASTTQSQPKTAAQQQQIPIPIGFARLITDHVTFAYLTDVYISPAKRGLGLGKWMVKCIKEYVDEMPELRRAMLVTGAGGAAIPFYEKEWSGMRVFRSGERDRWIMDYVPDKKAGGRNQTDGLEVDEENQGE